MVRGAENSGTGGAVAAVTVNKEIERIAARFMSSNLTLRDGWKTV